MLLQVLPLCLKGFQLPFVSVRLDYRLGDLVLQMFQSDCNEAAMSAETWLQVHFSLLMRNCADVESLCQLSLVRTDEFSECISMRRVDS